MRIKPSKRAKKRYIVFEVISNELNNDSAIHNAIKKSALNVLGVNYGEAGIRFLKDKYRESIHRGIFRVNNKYAKQMVGALNETKYLKTLGMSGILKKAEDKYLKIAS